MSYRDWGGYTPATPKKAKNGIRTKSRRGKIGESWWSGRFLGVLETLGMTARLARGKTYARKGQVMDLKIEPGLVTAKVQGTRARPYSVEIHLPPLAAVDWAGIFEAMSEKALFMAMLLAGEMPQEIEDVFCEVKRPLFPASKRDLDTRCSCPDWANPCKHIAAVFYILAEAFDEDPFLIFTLRGRTKNEVIEELRQIRGRDPLEEETAKGASLLGVPSLKESLGCFWSMGPQMEGFKLDMTQPAVPGGVLKGLGPCPISVGKKRLDDILAPLYEAVAEKASALALTREGQEGNGLGT